MEDNIEIVYYFGRGYCGDIFGSRGFYLIVYWVFLGVVFYLILGAGGVLLAFSCCYLYSDFCKLVIGIGFWLLCLLEFLLFCSFYFY